MGFSHYKLIYIHQNIKIEIEFIIFLFVRKEALISSQIERTQSSLAGEFGCVFLTGLKFTAEERILTAKRIINLTKQDHEDIKTLGKGHDTVWRIFEYMHKHPIITIPDIRDKLELSPHSVKIALDKLIKLNIVQEMGEKKRGKVFIYDKYLELLSEGGEPL